MWGIDSVKQSGQDCFDIPGNTELTYHTAERTGAAWSGQNCPGFQPGFWYHHIPPPSADTNIKCSGRSFQSSFYGCLASFFLSPIQNIVSLCWYTYKRSQNSKYNTYQNIPDKRIYMFKYASNPARQYTFLLKPGTTSLWHIRLVESNAMTSISLV